MHGAFCISNGLVQVDIISNMFACAQDDQADEFQCRPWAAANKAKAVIDSRYSGRKKRIFDTAASIPGGTEIDNKSRCPARNRN
jgi:hypothetical protein